MIFYLVHEEYYWDTIQRFLSDWGKPLAESVSIVTYESLKKQRRFDPGVYIFTDLERMSPREAEYWVEYWNLLAGCGKDIWLLNHPTQIMRRYELLRRLYLDRVNNFNVYRVSELRMPQHYPVFIRDENFHGGKMAPTNLLRNEAELQSAIEEISRSGKSRDDALITEFCDTSDAAGVYRKYSAFFVAGRVVAGHQFFSENWIVKYPEIVTKDTVQEELDYVRFNPHAEQIRQVFLTANIHYGRIDYGIENGRLRVWEINTNPQMGSFKDVGVEMRRKKYEVFVPRYIKAMRGLQDFKRRRLAGRLVRSTLKRTGLGRFEEKLVGKFKRGLAPRV